MKAKENNELEDLVKKIIKDASVEKPSLDFTTLVMSKVEAINIRSSIYKPLISKKGWLFISIIFLLMLCVSFYNSDSETSTLLNTLNFSYLSNNLLSKLFTGFNISKTFSYAIILFGIMVCLQIPILKYYFNQRLKY